ncbi:DUF317 domain-containing protein [Streptomyces sp. NPDC006285]|uniref:DUF317 domain-containing protein n=1 Tax=Streptomyces sp. NPDC006285 TaxID=3364742 RepID=UPI00369737AF
MKSKPRQGWGTAAQPDQHYLIQPRALAGGGDIRHVSEFLRASGWRDRSEKRGPLFMESPDRTIRLFYDPHVQPGGWTISGAARGHQAAWNAVLGSQTPVEILAGLTDALTQPLSAHAPDVWAPLRHQHWSTTYRAGQFTAESPDGTSWMQFHEDPPAPPVWWSGAGDQQGNGWTATFTATTPMHLVQAFTTALASPQPVMRPRGRIPHSAQIRTTSVSVLPSQLAAWQQARIQAARAAVWDRNWIAGSPRTTPRPNAAGHRARR